MRPTFFNSVGMNKVDTWIRTPTIREPTIAPDRGAEAAEDDTGEDQQQHLEALDPVHARWTCCR